MKNGIISAIGAYTLWGLLPIYWKAIQSVPSFEVVCHRVVWSFLFVALLLTGKRQWGWLRQAKSSPITLITFLGTCGLIALNWLTYIWAVSTGHIVDTSLGYFINPLISVLFGMLFLKERLRPWQWVAILVALGGVLALALGYGSFPWIALTLAITFALYGLLRKTAPLDALDGLALEMLFLFIPALAYLVYVGLAGSGSFGSTGLKTSVLLAFTGVVTALPLIWFANGARKVTLATVGILQYIAPTLQFLIGTFVYGESFTRERLVGFSAIWFALLIYSVEGITASKRRASNSVAARTIDRHPNHQR